VRPAVYMEVDTSRFDAALKQYLLTTRRDLHKAINARFFYLMVRLFVLVPPRSPGQERRRISDYLGKPLGDINRKSKKTGKRIGRSRLLRRVHLIVQAKEAKAGRRGLYGEEMKTMASAFMRKSIASVGYLRSAVVKAIRVYNKGFTQFQAQKWKPLVKPAGYKAPKKTNAALVALANQYGLPEENVAVHKGTRARGFQAVPGYNPTATIVMTAGIADNQYNRVASIYNPAMQRALDDETAELANHMTEALLANGKVLEDNGFDIK
jgi:hypothetical protein